MGILPGEGEQEEIMADRTTKTQWKSWQRDWLVFRLRELQAKWQRESASKESIFSPDPEVDRIAKGRTGGCSVELHDLLKELE
jgi:hypothetical protein